LHRDNWPEKGYLGRVREQESTVLVGSIGKGDIFRKKHLDSKEIQQIYPKECDTGYSRGTCTPMFIAAPFTIAKLPHY
jgi:hypothetical protein